jgi:N-sulfoglucosamine sulfohydrolase
MRPNIVFAFGDDWGRYASAYASSEVPSLNDVLSTPNVDRIAAEGALFANAHAPAPSCTPCRSSLLTGRYFWQTGLGAILEGARWDESIPTFPLLLESEAGYHIGYSYKVWSPGRTKNAPIGGERTRFEPAGNNFNEFSHWVTEHRDSLGLDESKEVLFDEVRKNFRAFLAAREDGKPFLYWWGPHNTHRTWERGSGRELWGIDPASLQGLLPAYLPDVAEVREDFADYLGECLAFDAGLGVLMEELEATGEMDETVVVVSGDHGVPGIPRGKCNLYDLGSEVALAIRWPGHIPAGGRLDQFVNLMDLAPTFLEAAGVSPPEPIAGRSLIDAVTGDDGPGEDEWNSVVIGRERHVAAARAGNLPYPQRAIRTAQHLFIINFEPDRWPMGDPNATGDDTSVPTVDELLTSTKAGFADMDASPTKAWIVEHRKTPDGAAPFEIGFGKRPRYELYDLHVDPDCLENLAADPAHSSLRDEMEDRLLEILRREDDPRVTEVPCRFEHGDYVSSLGEGVDAWETNAEGPVESETEATAPERNSSSK